jgi:hypothetical protein
MLSEITSKAGAVTAVAMRKCETKASFCSASPKFLWVGEFALGMKYPTTAPHHMKDRMEIRKLAWGCGYDRNNLMGAPTCVLAVRQSASRSRDADWCHAVQVVRQV